PPPPTPSPSTLSLPDALPISERRLLEVLVEQPNQVVSREDLIAGLTHDVYDFDTHRLDSLIHRLRRKVSRVLGISLPLNDVRGRSEEHTSELQSRFDLVCRLL